MFDSIKIIVVHRLLGEQSTVRRQRAPLQTNTAECSFDQYQNPPDYTTIIATETSQPNGSQATPIYSLQHDSALTHIQNTTNEQCLNTNEHQITVSPIHRLNRPVNRRYTTTNFPCQKPLEKIDSFSSTMPRRQPSSGPNSMQNAGADFRHLTAHDVAQLLRSTHRTTSNVPARLATTTQQTIDMDTVDVGSADQEDYSLTRSIEELVLNEVPPNRASYIDPSNESTTYCDKSN